MAFDLKAFSKELGLTAEEEGSLAAVLDKPERLTLLEKNQLRLPEFSKKMNELQKEQDKLSAAQTRLDAEAAEWASLSASEKTAATALRDSLEKSEAKVLTLTQRVSRIATDAGLDPAKALEGIDQPVEKKTPVAEPIDTSKFVGAEQFNALSTYLFNAMLDVPQIAAEHFELTGKRLNTNELRDRIVKAAQTKGANTDPRAIWEAMHDIPKIRETKTAEARALERTQDEQRGYERARSEAALPIPPSHGTHSPVLRSVSGEARKSVLERPVPETGVRSAAQALATGKYRSPQPAGAGA